MSDSRLWSPTSVRRDILAGLSLAAMNIPRVLGYTRIAGMPAVTGLYTVLLPLVAFACIGSSRHLVVGADSATAAIFSSAISQMAPEGSPHYITLVCAMTLLNAGFLLTARLFRLGFLADFLSRTVLVGFLAGAGVQVGLTMVYDMAGLHPDSHNPAHQIAALIPMLPHAHGLECLLSAVVCAMLLVGQALWPHIPITLAIIIMGMGLGWVLPLSQWGIPTLGQVSGGLPTLTLPWISWNDLVALLPVSASCVFVIITQSAATARAFADTPRSAADENRDILGLCAANAAAGLSGAFTVNGSPALTAMAVRSGATSQRAQLVHAGVTLCVLLFLSMPLHYLPRCILAAVVFCVAVGMVDVAALRAIRKESPGEFWLALTTAVSVVGIGVEQGIFIALALSLFRHVHHSYRPHTMVLRPDAASGALETEPVHPGAQTEPGIILYRFSADLFYANCALFARDITLLTTTAPSPVHCVVVDCSAITDIDYSAASTVRAVIGTLHEAGIQVFFGRVAPYALADMERHGIVNAVGQKAIFSQLHTALEAARKANHDADPTTPLA